MKQTINFFKRLFATKCNFSGTGENITRFSMCHDIDMSLKVDLKPVDIEVYVVNDIVRAGCMKRLVAGVQVVPHAIFTEQLIKLSAGQLLCIFVLLSTGYHKFSLLCHADAPHEYNQSLHIVKFDFPRLFFLFQKRIQHMRTVVPNFRILLLKDGI